MFIVLGTTLSIIYFLAYGAFLDQLKNGVKNKYISKVKRYDEYKHYYSYGYLETLEASKNIYKEGREQFESILPNSVDCDLLNNGDYGKYSCERILDNECYKDSSKCININRTLYNHLKFNEHWESPHLLNAMTGNIIMAFIFGTAYIFFLYISKYCDMRGDMRGDSRREALKCKNMFYC